MTKRTVLSLTSLALLTLGGLGAVAQSALPFTFTTGTPAKADDVNANFKALNDKKLELTIGKPYVSVGDANGTAAMLHLRGGSTCCSGPGGYTPADFKIFQNGSFVSTGNLGIGVSPMQGTGYRTSWDSFKAAFRSGHADTEWDDTNVGFMSWAGGSKSTASGLYSLAFGDANFARGTSSIVFGSGNEVKGAAGISAGAGNRVCDTYGVAFGNKAISGGPIVADGKCDPETFNIRGLAAIAMGYYVTASQDHTTALGKFASNNGFTGTFIWGDGAAQQSADTFRNTANNEFAARASGGVRLRTNLGGTTGCNLPAGSGVWNCTSDKNAKKAFQHVDATSILDKVLKLPVTTWVYKDDATNARHMGPTAQDFYAAFKLGDSDKSIGHLDQAGVAFASIQGLDAKLNAEIAARDEKIEALEAGNAKLAAENAAMRAQLGNILERLEKLER